MTTPVQQVRNSLTYLLPVVISSAVPLVTLPVYTRTVPAADLGAWALCLAYAAFITGIGNFGLTLGYERNFFEHREPADRAGLLYSTVAFVVTVFVLCGLLTWVFRDPIARTLTGSTANASLLVCTTAAHAVMSLKAYFLIYFRNTGNARAHSWYSVDEVLAAALLSVGFLLVLDSGVIGIPAGQLLASLSVLGALLWRFVRELPPVISLPLLGAALSISYPLTPRILLGVAGNQVDKYFLGLLGTLGGVGVYIVGQRLAHLVFAFMTALENVFTPQVYDRMFNGGPSGGATIGRYLTPFAYVSVLAALGLGLFAEEAITILTDAAYHGAIPVAGILCLHYAIMFFGKLPQLVYAKRTGLISVLTLIGLAANAGLNVLLVRRWGATGAAAATFGAGVLSVALVVVLGQRYYPIRWQYSAMAAIFGLLFAGVIGALWLRAEGFPYVVRLSWKLVVIATYAALGFKLGIASGEGAELARRALGTRFGFGGART